ncbi:MAG: hypothetical protein ACOX2Q_11450 [Dehalobacterium sp.]|jgi:hypothetical protein
MSLWLIFFLHNYKGLIRILNTLAISTNNTNTDNGIYNKEFESDYLNMSDSEFHKTLRGAIRDLIKRKENGEIFKWDKTFVETVVKPYFPELFEEIQKQMN